MAKLFTCVRDGFVTRAETDGELAARVERHLAEADADPAGKLDAHPDDWRSYFAKGLAAVSTTTANGKERRAHRTPKARFLP